MSNSVFDVYNCPEEEVTTAWVDVEEEIEVDFSSSVGEYCSITDHAWVSSDGDDNNNYGLDYESLLRRLPKNVIPAYDGLKLSL